MNVRNGRLVSLDIVLELCAISLKDQIFNENINFTLSNEFYSVLDRETALFKACYGWMALSGLPNHKAGRRQH